jgi:hypothetical protein
MHVPPPDLRIIPVDAPQPHEEHDSQRSAPLIEKIRYAKYFTNPPVVTHTEDNQYVILDGANRCYTFATLEFPYILVQVVSYFGGQVELGTWNHVVSDWDADAFMALVDELGDIEMLEGQHKHAIAHVCLPNGSMTALNAPVQSVHERNTALRDFVRIYQRNATLNRTPLTEPTEVWKLFPQANALVIFPGYRPNDIIEAARYQAYLPPGISRHIVHGRALQLNYPADVLRDSTESLEAKNEQLSQWLTDKLLNRQVRYYAEATYQFNE